MARTVPASSRSAVPPAPPERTALLAGIAAALALGTLGVFARALSAGFINYDDPDYVTANPHVQGGLTLENMRWALTHAAASNWHPLTWWSHQLDVTLFGLNPAAHHATSVLLHACAVVLAFLALVRLTGAVARSAVVAALFAVHPLRVESVAWVAERKDVLSGTLFFGSLLAYAVYAERRRARAPAVGPYVLALLGAALGLMAKPMLVTLPGVLLLLDVWPLRRPKLAGGGDSGWALLVEKLPFALLSAVSSYVTYRVQSASGAVTAQLSLPDRFANALVSIPRYVGKLLWPADLAVLYPHPGHWPAAAVLGAAAVVLAVTVFALGQVRGRPWWTVGWCWFLGMLVPVSGLVQVGLQSMADRYTYLPTVGLLIALVWGLAEAGGPAMRAARVGGTAVVLLLCAGATVVQLGVWKNSITLFRHTIAVAGRGNYLAHDNLGIALGEAGDTAGALAEHREALAIRPDYPNANNNLARLLADRGELDQAIAHYRVALHGRPQDLEIHNNLANALSDAGRLDEAVAEYRWVLARAPHHLNALNGYAVTEAMRGDVAGAERDLREILRIAPDNLAAMSNLGNVLALSNRPQQAAEVYRQALRTHPDDAKLLYNLGTSLQQLGRTDDAIDVLQRAVAASPANTDAHARLGLLLAQSGRRADAVREFQIALQQRPNDPNLHQWLAAARGP